MFEAVLFDMDGVLVETEGFYARRRAAFLAEQGVDVGGLPDLTGANDKLIWETIVPEDQSLRRRLREGYIAYGLTHRAPLAELLSPGVREVLEGLRRCGVKTAIASSSRADIIDELVAVAGIGGCVDFRISGHECRAFKPDPEIYLRAMGALGVSPAQSLVIEDSPLGIEAGRAAGATVWALEPPSGTKIDQSAAHHRIGSLAEILEEFASQGPKTAKG